MISINFGWMDNHGRSLFTFSAYQAGQSFMWTSMSWWPVVASAAVWRTNVNRNMWGDVTLRRGNYTYHQILPTGCTDTGLMDITDSNSSTVETYLDRLRSPVVARPMLWKKNGFILADIVVTTSPVDAYMCLHLLRQTIWDREVSVLIIDRKLV